MANQQFFMKLIPPRAMSPADMTEAERALMGQHAIYVQGFFDRGQVLAYGPVLDASGAFGVALLEMSDLEEAQRFANGDPTVKAGMNTYTITPMLIAASQSTRGGTQRA